MNDGFNVIGNESLCLYSLFFLKSRKFQCFSTMTTAAELLVVQNLRTVLQCISESGASQAVRLIAVSKTFPSELVWACYRDAGHRDFGENYVQELERKAMELAVRGASEIRWHYIGRIQTKMIKRLCAVPNLCCVETVDNAQHADALQTAVQSAELKLNVFIQVNASAEANKGGVKPEELNTLAKHITERCPNLRLLGLMTIGSIGESMGVDGQNADFALLRALRDGLERELGLNSGELELSMGMSADYLSAIKYGSTNVRVGSTTSLCNDEQREVTINK